MINNIVWLALAAISFLAGQAYLFSRLLSWDKILENFFRR